MSATGYTASMDMGCGVNLLGYFEKSYASAAESHGVWWAREYANDLTTVEFDEPGAGFAIAAFIDDEKCEAAYETLKKRWPILYQSPVRINENTGNNFYFCVFDTKEENES